MRFVWRPRLRIGPFVFYFSNGRFTSWGIKVWRYSWNARSHVHTVDTPGPGVVKFGGGR